LIIQFSGYRYVDPFRSYFKLNFKCAPLNFFWETPFGSWCALASLGQSLERVKISGFLHPVGAEI